MMSTIDDRYFEWLYSQIAAVSNRNPERSYWKLARKLYTTEFIWSVPNDDNRAVDGTDLRYEFMDAQGSGKVDTEWLSLGCSVLEMIVALARRGYFQTDKPPIEWFHMFMQNLGLDMYNDNNYTNVSEPYINEALEHFLHRNYRRNGEGGLFPLKLPTRDQRQVELYYQMSAYIIENSMV